MLSNALSLKMRVIRVGCRGFAPPNSIWRHFARPHSRCGKCLFVVALCRFRYRRFFRSVLNVESPVRRRVVVCNAPPHCVPWYCFAILSFCLAYIKKMTSIASKSGKASVENCSLSATSTAYNSINSILQFLQDLRGSSSAVGLLRLVLRSERRHQ